LVGVARKALDAISPGNVLNQRPYIVTRSYTPTQIYTFIHTKTYTHVSARARTHERKPMLVCVHAQVHTKSHTHTHTHPLAHTHTRAPHTDTPKKSRVHARERAYTHTHTHTHARTHPQTHTQFMPLRSGSAAQRQFGPRNSSRHGDPKSGHRALNIGIVIVSHRAAHGAASQGELTPLPETSNSWQDRTAI
jgi:hypothetical protein